MSYQLRSRKRPHSVDRDALAGKRHPTPDLALEEPLQPYEYQPLDHKAQEIRLLRLLPAGNPDEEIEIQIFHARLIEPERALDTRLGFEELEKTLPPGWELHTTLENGRYIFQEEDSLETQWTHPNPEIDQGLYHCASVMDPYSDFKPAYEALSYCWGENHITAKARVLPMKTGRTTTLELRPNLALALKHLRQDTSPRILWIDAICIDQTNVSERNHEVKKMDTIYKLAQRVVVWLGPASESSTRGLELLAALGEKIVITSDLYNLDAPIANRENSSNSFVEDVHKRFETFEADQQAPYDSDHLQAILDILSRPWWGRLCEYSYLHKDILCSIQAQMGYESTSKHWLGIRLKLTNWIWQEICLANSRSIVQSGSNFKLWVDLRKAILFLASKLPQGLKTTEFVHFLDRGNNLAVCSGPQDDLLYILQQTRFAEHANLHDRVFALLGMADPENAALINADYSRPVYEVFRDVCSAHLQLYRDFNFLRYCELSTHGQNSGHPSWVPNWSAWRPVHIFGSQDASGKSQALIDALNGSRLKVDGVLCGIVEEVSHVAPLEGHLRETTRIWEQLVAKNDPQRIERFVETLSCDETKEAWPNYFQYPSCEQYKVAYYNNDEEPIVSDSVRGRSVFICDDERMGICPAGAKAGDLLVAVLGCESPVILRKCPSDHEPATYVVVGVAFVSSLKHSAALLGSLPYPFRASTATDWEGCVMPEFKDLDNGTITYDDPRLGPLPKGWIYAKDFNEDQLEARVFKSRETGNVTYFDPRLTPEELRKRGTKVEEFILV
ncbi:uncharacterized protein CC84DRAFT_221947 [Paraphaeosphaeria sporulosa]|uniref:WW domain-containing protein n=1 Tax=Paraphaeosphaeria sporulosa TaxID=1460663 RepID=A0A177C323_9PLEO|nr:uncharacterized protein CC84DRAFT_221947 [Paraphaeosphaeria sporulosa]OAG01796.1 hypothetical protein CC84DRAFT_221947 [Paraphaeosphaeria sporulosa]